MTLMSVHFPDNSGWVLAAYLVFFALLVIYLGITTYRMTRLEQRLTKLTEELDRAELGEQLDTPREPAGKGTP